MQHIVADAVQPASETRRSPSRIVQNADVERGMTDATRQDAPGPKDGGRSRELSVLLIDERPLTRESLSGCLIANARGFRVTPVASVAEVTQSTGDPSKPRVVLFNIGAQRLIDPPVPEQIRHLSEVLADAPVMVMSEWDELDLILQGLRHGVRGYVTPRFPMSVLVEAIRLVCAGGTFVPATCLAALGERGRAPLPSCDPEGEAATAPAVRGLGAASGLAGLTPREMDVLACLRQGKSNKIIAHELAMSESTVKVHVRHIMRKIGATNRTQVAYLTRQFFDPAL